MSSLYSHNHYNEQGGTLRSLCSRCPSLSLPTATTKIILTIYFTILFVFTTWCVIFVDYVQNLNLKYFQLYFVLFFSLILVVVILSWLRQHYGDGHSIVIPMWLLGVANIIICLSGFFSLFSFGWTTRTGPLLLAWIISFFNQLTLIIIAAYTIYRAFFTMPTNQPYTSTHRQYALAATGDMDDSDVELELDLYTTSDQYHLHQNNSSIHSHDSQQFSHKNSYKFAAIPTTTTTTTTTTSTTTSPKTGMTPIPQPNFDMNLNDEYTDVE